MRWNLVREKLTSRMNKRVIAEVIEDTGGVSLFRHEASLWAIECQCGGASVARHLFYNEYLKAIAPFDGVNNTR